ncbi:PREDICTED: glutaredoxin-C1-like [Fragaria vesca subsp. vesca]|uniref:glutaredoxin-C1-like n=1 Tax=Fragaria vesca subsp. vesca TaxID=101020 RepID=UPI0002C364C9|nr:PREDICTED: glutaredoxin-C1-like [Fragaria vesca subsp. vesca]
MEVAKMISSNASEATEKVEASRRRYEMVWQLGSCDRVVVVSASGCPMCTVAEHLLFSLGVGPTIVVLDRHVDGPAIREVLREMMEDEQQPAVPAVFIGGKFLGAVEALMAYHINGNLVPLLKHSGALWL